MTWDDQVRREINRLSDAEASCDERLKTTGEVLAMTDNHLWLIEKRRAFIGEEQYSFLKTISLELRQNSEDSQTTGEVLAMTDNHLWLIEKRRAFIGEEQYSFLKTISLELRQNSEDSQRRLRAQKETIMRQWDELRQADRASKE